MSPEPSRYRAPSPPSGRPAVRFVPIPGFEEYEPFALVTQVSDDPVPLRRADMRGPMATRRPGRRRRSRHGLRNLVLATLLLLAVHETGWSVPLWVVCSVAAVGWAGWAVVREGRAGR